jgi:hypothetical protein
MVQRHVSLRLVLVMGLASSAPPTLLAQGAEPPETYTVTQVTSMLGPAVTMEISRDGNRAVGKYATVPAR